MADAPEIPEATNPFEKQVALTIAILAVVLAFDGNAGDNAKTDAIVFTTQAANKWAYFQSKSIKQNIAESNLALLNALTATDPAKAKAEQEKLAGEVARYDTEKKQLSEEAKELEKSADHGQLINDRSDRAALFLQVAIVLCSVSILVHWRAIYYAGIGLGVAGTIAACFALFG